MAVGGAVLAGLVIFRAPVERLGGASAEIVGRLTPLGWLGQQIAAWPALAATLLPCASTQAQTSKVLPLAATSTEGNSTCYYPFFFDACRAQVIWESGSVASGAAVISGVNFRRDGSNNATAPARWQATRNPLLIKISCPTIRWARDAFRESLT